MTTPATGRARPSSTAPCPCGSGKTFGECCEPVLLQQRRAETAEELMRSRFTAHAVGDGLHLHRTDLETVKQPFNEDELGEGPQWTRLVINAHETGVKPDLAFVDFTAFYRVEGGEAPLHEKSEFVRVKGEWFYTRAVRSGPAPAKAAPKVGRNDPCPCGSGKKFKHCHGK